MRLSRSEWRWRDFQAKAETARLFRLAVSSARLLAPARFSVWGVSSACLLVLLAFLASAVGAKKALSETFGMEHLNRTQMMRINGGLNLENVKWFRQTESTEMQTCF